MYSDVNQALPARAAIVIEALMYAGLKVGLPRELSLYSSAQAFLGAAKLIMDGKFNASQIKAMVTTPGGTTIEGIYQLEYGKLRTALMNAVEAAYAFLKTQFSMALNKVRGRRKVAVYALYIILYHVLTRKAAENIGRPDKVVSPTFFNT